MAVSFIPTDCCVMRPNNTRTYVAAGPDYLFIGTGMEFGMMTHTTIISMHYYCRPTQSFKFQRREATLPKIATIEWIIDSLSEWIALMKYGLSRYDDEEMKGISKVHTRIRTYNNYSLLCCASGESLGKETVQERERKRNWRQINNPHQPTNQPTIRLQTP